MTAGILLEVLLLAGVLALPLFLTETMDSRVRTTPVGITIVAPPKGVLTGEVGGTGTGNPNAPVPVKFKEPKLNNPDSPLIFDPTAINRPVPEDTGGDWDPSAVPGPARWGTKDGADDPSLGNTLGIGIGAAPPPPAGPVRIGGIIKPPRLVRQIRPSYPQIARTGRIQGDVVLEAVLDANGRVRQLKVVDGHPLLAPSALRAVQQWVYEPTYLNGRPVAISMQITVKFRLGR